MEAHVGEVHAAVAVDPGGHPHHLRGRIGAIQRGEQRRSWRLDTIRAVRSNGRQTTRFLNHWLDLPATWGAIKRTNPGYADVIALLPDVAPTVPMVPAASTTREGFVYLLKSGRYHKIGQTTSVPRRWAEIAGAAPDTVELVHYFKTDDAIGIEAYWHRRFAAQRHGGEWFTLHPQDVAAFKRRPSLM